MSTATSVNYGFDSLSASPLPRGKKKKKQIFLLPLDAVEKAERYQRMKDRKVQYLSLKLLRLKLVINGGEMKRVTLEALTWSTRTLCTDDSITWWKAIQGNKMHGSFHLLKKINAYNPPSECHLLEHKKQ